MIELPMLAIGPPVMVALLLAIISVYNAHKRDKTAAYHEWQLAIYQRRMKYCTCSAATDIANIAESANQQYVPFGNFVGFLSWDTSNPPLYQDPQNIMMPKVERPRPLPISYFNPADRDKE